MKYKLFTKRRPIIVNRIDIQPGDRILLTTENPITENEARQFKEAFNLVFEGVEVIVVSGVELTIIGNES